jgi:hypothetical protein
MFLHLVSANYLDDYRVLVKFNESSEGIVDFFQSLEDIIFKPLQDPNYFSQFSLDHELGTLVWTNGPDFAPEYLYFLAFRGVPDLHANFK